MRARPTLPTVYLAGACVALAGFVMGAALLAVTLPYHQWDSFGFATWSLAIAQHGTFDPFFAGPQSAARPLFYELQGLIWSATGISFTAGRLLSLAFAVVLPASVYFLGARVTQKRLEAALALAVSLAVVPFAAQALTGETDVPAAAMVALVAALALRPPQGRKALAGLAVAALAAVLTKQTVLLALVPLAAFMLAGPLRELRDRVLGPAGALLAGLMAGLGYDLVMAHRYGTSLLVFLGEGTGGFWAQLAAQTRADAVLRADVLGSGLRLPLTFALVYSILRLAQLRHRPASLVALAVGLVWCIAGPLAAGVPNGAFSRPEDGFTLVGFAMVLAAAALLREDDAPRRSTLVLGLLLGLPPLLAWVDAATYTERLAATAWPGLALLLACVLAAGVRGLARVGTAFAVAPLLVVAMAVWMSLASLDGLHGSMWVEYRSLGIGGLGDKARTMHVVLPALQSTLATVESQLGGGRVVTGDPMFPYFLPGRVDTSTPGRCADVRGERVFVLLTGNESVAEAQQAGRLATPEQWAACRSPRLRQLTDGSNGYAVFAVDG